MSVTVQHGIQLRDCACYVSFGQIPYHMQFDTSDISIDL